MVHDLWRSPMQDTQTMKVLVFRDQHAAVLHCQLPNDRVGRSAFAKKTNDSGKRSRNAVTNSSDNCSSKSRHTTQAAGIPNVRRSRSAA
jgi:hypothetical protein